MPFSFDKAQAAMDRVQQRWGSRVPRHLVRYTARDLFHFDQTTFNARFGQAFASHFHKADLTCPHDQCLAGCAAFASPDQSHAQRRIYINVSAYDTQFDPMALLAHEYLHWLSHANFYPDYYAGGGDNIIRVEGVTEWMTLKCFNGFFDWLPAEKRIQFFSDRESYFDYFLVARGITDRTTLKTRDRAAYFTQLEKIRSWVKNAEGKTDPAKADAMVAFLFEGKYVALG